MALQVNVNGTWKDAAAVQVNVGGTWKQADAIQTNVGGQWKESFLSGPSLVVYSVANGDFSSLVNLKGNLTQPGGSYLGGNISNLSTAYITNPDLWDLLSVLPFNFTVTINGTDSYNVTNYNYGNELGISPIYAEGWLDIRENYNFVSSPILTMSVDTSINTLYITI